MAESYIYRSEDGFYTSDEMEKYVFVYKTKIAITY